MKAGLMPLLYLIPSGDSRLNTRIINCDSGLQNINQRTKRTNSSNCNSTEKI